MSTNARRLSFMAAWGVVSLLSFPRPAAADDPCELDKAQVCFKPTPGQGRVLACMVANIAKLSPECAAAVTQTNKLLPTVRANCANDVQSFCAVETKATGRIDCLENFTDRISPACLQSYQELKALPYQVDF